MTQWIKPYRLLDRLLRTTAFDRICNTTRSQQIIASNTLVNCNKLAHIMHTGPHWWDRSAYLRAQSLRLPIDRATRVSICALQMSTLYRLAAKKKDAEASNNSHLVRVRGLKPLASSLARKRSINWARLAYCLIVANFCLKPSVTPGLFLGKEALYRRNFTDCSKM